jgi:enoyl-CoA hydratase/carnithine racemase
MERIKVRDFDDGVTLFTINRPERRNAICSKTAIELQQAFARFDKSTQRVAVITGEGNEAFSAGADVNDVPELWRCIPTAGVGTEKPVISAVAGWCVGGAILLPMMSDLVVAADDARFGITEAKWGRGAPWSTPLFSLIGARHALELMVTAEPIDAYRAREMGLVNHVVPVAELAARAQALAHRIATLAPLSIRTSVQMVRVHRAQVAGDLADTSWTMWEPVYESADAQEGPRAFTEKRPPRWQGK